MLRRALPLVFVAATGCAQVLDYQELRPSKTSTDDTDNTPDPQLPVDPSVPLGPAPNVTEPAPRTDLPVRFPHATTCGEWFGYFCDDFENRVATTFHDDGAPTGWSSLAKPGCETTIGRDGPNHVFEARTPPAFTPLATEAALALPLPARARSIEVIFRMRKPIGPSVIALTFGFTNGAVVRLGAGDTGRLSLDEAPAADKFEEEPIGIPGPFAAGDTWHTYSLTLDLSSDTLGIFADGKRVGPNDFPLGYGIGADVAELRIGQMPLDDSNDGGAVAFDDVGVHVTPGP